MSGSVASSTHARRRTATRSAGPSGLPKYDAPACRQHVVELLVLSLRQGGRHCRRRRCTAKAAWTCKRRCPGRRQSFPADLLEVGELEVAPRLDAARPRTRDSPGRRTWHVPARPAPQRGSCRRKKFEAVVFVHHAHVVGAVEVRITGDDLQVLGIFEDHVLE